MNNYTAKRLPEAREQLRIDLLNETEKQAYYRNMEAIRYQKSVISTGWIEGKEEGRAEGAKMKQFEIARKSPQEYQLIQSFKQQDCLKKKLETELFPRYLCLIDSS